MPFDTVSKDIDETKKNRNLLDNPLVNFEQKKSEWLMEFPIKERLTKKHFK